MPPRDAYMVIALNPATHDIALRDAAGHCHIARADTTPPLPGDVLRGSAAVIGPCDLRFADDRGDCAVVFVALDCPEHLARLLLEVELPP